MKAKNNINQLERMKKLCLNSAYSCNGEIYKFLNGDILPKLIINIPNGTTKLSSTLVYGKEVITNEEKFLENLDKYIGYVKDHYFIDYIEQYMLIELSLNNKYSNILFCLDDFHKNQNYLKFFDGFRKMFLFNLYDNIRYYSKYISNISPIKLLLHKLKQYNFNNAKDIIEIEKILLPIINNRQNNLYQSFIPYTEVEKEHYNFYINQIEWVINDYYEHSYYDFCIDGNDNYITTNNGNKILFNIQKKNLLKKEFIVKFGVQNKYFRADKIICFRKDELEKLLHRLKKLETSKKYDTNYDFIDSSLRFNFWNEEKIQFLDIRFEYSDNNDYYIISLDPIDTKELYNLINSQLCNKK